MDEHDRPALPHRTPVAVAARAPRRALRGLAPLVPVVLLAAVVGIGLAGPAPEPTPVQFDLPTEAPEVSVPTSAPVPPSPDATPTLERTLFPARIAGLQVHGVRWTVQARNRGLARGVIAVAGYLAMELDACGDAPDGFDPWCARTGVLAETPWSTGAGSETRLPPYHLHPQLPPGVRLPVGAMRASRSGNPAMPVIVLARFDDARAAPCVPGGRHCGQELVVERIAWADGEDFAGILAGDPAIRLEATEGEAMRTQSAFAVSSLAPGGYPLLAVFVTPATLARLYPEAPTVRGDDRPVWYVRGLHEAGDPDRIDWLVVDAERKVILADGTIATNRLASPGD